MRKTIISAVVVAAALTLAACGGSDDSGDNGDAGADATTGEETPAGEDEGDEDEDEEGGEIADLSTALLSAEDLPEGAQVQPFDANQFGADLAGMSEMMEDITYEPAECGQSDASANPLGREGVESAGMMATVGEMPAIDVLVNAVYAGASPADLDAVTDFVDKCPTVTVSGTVAGQAIDTTVTNSVTEALDIDADAAIAQESTIESSGMVLPPTRVIYVIDGDHGFMISANPESDAFNLDALVQISLDKLRAAQG